MIKVRPETADLRKILLPPGTGLDLSEEAIYDKEEMEAYATNDSNEDWEQDEKEI